MNKSIYDIRNNKGFSLIEVMIVLVILAVLIAIIYPAIDRARQNALREQCANNLRQLYQAMIMYADDNDGYFPSGGGWAWDIYPNYINDDSIFDCPAHPNKPVGGHVGDHTDPDYYFHNGGWGSNLHPLSIYDSPNSAGYDERRDLYIMWCYDKPHDGGQMVLNTSGRTFYVPDEEWDVNY